MKGTTIFARLT